MAHSLYRFYLYVVFLAMLVLAAVGLGMLLQPLLGLTPLHGANNDFSLPTHEDVVRGGVFFVVSWVVAGLLGGLHYWLIRRDMQHDAQAGNDGVRAFFLNFSQLIATPVAIGMTAFGVISNLQVVFYPPAGAYVSDFSGTAAFAIATLALCVGLALERWRVPATGGVALVFQRLHLYGVQLIMLTLLTFAWQAAGRLALDTLQFGGQVTCGGGQCSTPPLISSIGAVVWIALCWIGYGYLARNDNKSLLRRILHYISFAYGVGWILYGIYRGLELGLLMGFGVSVQTVDILNTYNFVAYVLFGLLVVFVYMAWLRAASSAQAHGWVGTLLVGEAITSALMAGAFWWGIGILLFNLLQLPVAAHEWTDAIALLITGVLYIPLDFYLHRSKVQAPQMATESRRGYILALLGGGALSAAIGGAVALYALITSALGSSLNDPNVQRAGIAAFVVGVLLLLIYLWIARREQLLSGLIRRPTSVSPVSPVSTTTPPAESMPVAVEPVPSPAPSVLRVSIEEVVDELLAGKVTRDEAVARLLALESASVVH